MPQDWRSLQRFCTHTCLLRGCFLLKSWLARDDASRQQWFGAAAQISDFSLSPLLTPLHALSGVSLLSAKHHDAPRAGQRGSGSQAAGGGEGWRSDGNGVPRLLRSLLRPGTITDSIHIIGIFSPLKLWPQCLRSSLYTMHSYLALFFKVKETSSIPVWQSKGASEC